MTILSLDVMPTAPDWTQTRHQQIPGVGFALPPGLTVIAGAFAIGTTSLALKIIAELVSSSADWQTLMVPIADGPAEVSRRLSRYAPVLELAPDAGSRIWLDDGAAVCAEDIAKRARGWAAEHRKARKLIVIDDLQHLAPVESKTVAGGREASILRELAFELDTTVIMCAGLRIRRRRASWVPARSELLAYGPILRHCDATVLIYREGYYDRDAGSPGEVDLQLWPPQAGRSALALTWDTTRGTFGPPLS